MNSLDDMDQDDLRAEVAFEQKRRQRELHRICNPHLQTTDVGDDYMEEENDG